VAQKTKTAVICGDSGILKGKRMRELLFTFLLKAGACHLFQYINRRSLTILLYHGVAPKHEQGIYNYKGKNISPEAFRKQLSYIARHYTVLPLDESVQKLRENNLPLHALAITFDDGYRNFYTHALPLLKEFNMPATVFLVTDFVLRKKPIWVDRLEYAIGQKNAPREQRIAEDTRIRGELKMLTTRECERRLEPIERQAGSTLEDFLAERAVYAPLNEGEIIDMRRAGITIGAHTKSHPSLPHLSELDAKEEIGGSKRALERHFGAISQLFCYPSGRWNETTERLVREAGFAGALTTVEGVNTSKTHPFRLRRFSMDGIEHVARCAAAISGLRSFLRNTRRPRNQGQSQASV
jgi:peptidoglycan/xylan/chitin deacetylase (PgdA/CDA1 family)